MAERASDARALSVVLACGGTGGHVYPALAIARALKERHPAGRVSFIGRPDSFESRAIEREGHEMDALAIGRLVGQGLATRLRTMAQLPVAVVRAASALRRRRPAVVVGTGGFVSGPALLAAFLLRVPTVVQEQNAVPGLTNRVLCALARRVALAHPRTGAQSSKYLVTGNPVRPAFFGVAPWAERTPFSVLVMGGSQGARRLNALAVEAAGALGDLAGRVRFTIQAGPAWEEETRERARALRSGVEVEVVPYLHDVPSRLEAASLVVCRSGASTIAEICAAGRPSILVPFPASAGDHQTSNARALAEAGAAEWIAESGLTGERLAARIRRAVAEPAELRAMASAARKAAREDAAERVARLCEEVAR